MGTVLRSVCCCFKSKSRGMSDSNEEIILKEEKTSMKLESTKMPNEEFATFGAGCYWGTEKYFVTIFQKQHPGYVLG